MSRIPIVIALCAACSSRAQSGGGGSTASDARDAGVVVGSVAADAASAPRPPAPTPPLVVGADGVARGALPADLPPRVAAVLAEPVPDAVVVRFAEIARGDDPTGNYRWDLDRGGRLFFVRHSDKKDGVAFDRPLPDRPSLRLDAKHVRQVFTDLDAARFADHPGFETVPGAIGGTTVIVRARGKDGGPLHTVVFDVSRPDLLDFLESMTVTL
jgi:hypothetical protein